MQSLVLLASCFSSNSTPIQNIASLKCSKTCNFRAPRVLLPQGRKNGVVFSTDGEKLRRNVSIAATRGGGGEGSVASELDENVRKILQSLLWTAEGIYVIWLFLLPYAPGGSCLGHQVVGIHLLEAPVLHPMSEGLFNFVIGWTLMFAPLLYTDKRRERYKGSLDVLWGFQMFLTNTFLIPFMAIRLNKADGESTQRKTSQLGSVMTNGAPIVGAVGGIACLFSIVWALYGRGDGKYGDFAERLEFLLSYLGSERLAYAFIWDIGLYTIFQPWLIGDNLQNVQKDKVAVVNFLRFVPVIGLVAYCLCLDTDNEI